MCDSDLTEFRQMEFRQPKFSSVNETETLWENIILLNIEFRQPDVSVRNSVGHYIVLSPYSRGKSLSLIKVCTPFSSDDSKNGTK